VCYEKSLIEYILSEPNSLPAVQFQRFTDAMPGGFLIYRADNGEILYTNRGLLRILGCDSMEDFRTLTGNTFQGLVHPADTEEVERSIQEQIASNEYKEDYVEYHVLTKDGSVRWVEDRGHFVHSPTAGDIFYVFIADATEKRQRQLDEMAVINQEHLQRMEMIQGLSIDYESLFYVDLDSDCILPYHVGGKIAGLFDGGLHSRSFTEVTGEYICAWVIPEDQPLVTEALTPDNLRCRLTNQRTYHINYRVGSDAPEYLQFRFVNAGGMNSISQIVLGCRSVDEEIRHSLEQNRILETALTQIKAANAIKDVFLSNMSHDLRTPMNAIVGFTTLAKNHIDDRKKLRNYLNMIESASGRLLHLLDDVLEFSRLDAGAGHVEETLCSLREIGRNLQATLLPRAEEKGLQFSLETSTLEHDSVYCDRYNLTLLLMRLTENAVKYTRRGGRVAVTFTEEHIGPEFGTFHFIVEDTGIGISKEFLPHIFDPFERENNTTMSGVDGTGLGLTIVKNIVDLMGGSVNVNSVQGRGSRFIVTLNLALPHPAKENPPAKIRAQNLPSRQEPHRLLVVEDNEINLEIEMELLEDAGFLVDAAENGSIAVEKVRRSQPGDYSLILMDLQMPVLDGFGAAQAIRSLENPALANIPIIALSANAFEEDRRKAVACGMNTHLPKPIDIARLLSTIDELTAGQ